MYTPQFELKKLKFEPISLNSQSAKIEQSESETPKFDIDSINTRLGKGDKEALKELETNRISYSLTESASGYTIKYSYEGINYTIVYFASGATSQGNSDSTNTKPVEPTVSEETEENEGAFNYSEAGIDKNKKVEEYVGVKSKDNFEMPGNHSQWDILYAEIEKIKPQLLEYLKTQLNKEGTTLEDSHIEKILNAFATTVIDDFTWNSKHYTTIEDVINTIKQGIDNLTLDYRLRSTIDLPRFVTDSEWFVDSDRYLLFTDYYFLSDDEKKMKACLEWVDAYKKNNGESSVRDKNRVIEYMNVYAEHIKKDLKSEYPNLTDNEIDSIIDVASRKTIQELKTNSDGMYGLGENLTKFEELCFEYAE